MPDTEFDARLDAVLRTRVPDCEGLVAVERLSGGASQETYRVTARTGPSERLLAMRRAPGGIKPETATNYPGPAGEALLMRTARAAGVPEPEVYHVLTEDDGLGEGFLMEWLEGEALGARIVRSPDLVSVRPGLAYECGRILARIHAIDLAASGLDQVLARLTPVECVEMNWERYREYGTPQPMIDYAARWLLDNLPSTGTSALVHNDFRNGNLMVSADSPTGVVAVLDWETAHIGDPMRDLGWICTNSWRFGKSDLPVGGFGHYDDLIAGYESVSQTPVDRDVLKFWEVYGSFWWAVGCLGMAEHYRTGPDNTVERPAIGRRSSECQVDCVNLLIPGPVEPVTGIDPNASEEMPRIDELLVSVRDFLRGDVMAETRGRTNFLARVGANSLAIVRRDLLLGGEHRACELARLQALFGTDVGLDALRWRLVAGLRDGSIPLDLPGLAGHLRATVVNQVAIDQPRYSGFRTALDYR